MFVKDIILKACDFTENYELAESLLGQEELSSEDSEKVNMLLKCFNLVHNEIASEYFPIVKFKRVECKNGKLSLKDIDANLIDIITVKDVLGDSLKFKKFDGTLEVNASIVDVCYSTSPEELTLEDEFVSSLPERVYAYGVTREYFFLQTLYDDAEVWDARLKTSVQNFQRKKSETYLPRRRWI